MAESAAPQSRAPANSTRRARAPDRIGSAIAQTEGNRPRQLTTPRGHFLTLYPVK